MDQLYDPLPPPTWKVKL
jgi:hypothetical protein